jgi:hypothetical protein
MKTLTVILVLKILGLGGIELPGFKNMSACNEAAAIVRKGVVIQNGLRLELAGRVEDAHCEERHQ